MLFPLQVIVEGCMGGRQSLGLLVSAVSHSRAGKTLLLTQGKNLPAQNLTAAHSWASTEFHSDESENWTLHLLKGRSSGKKSMLRIECTCFLNKLVVI